MSEQYQAIAIDVNDLAASDLIGQAVTELASRLTSRLTAEEQARIDGDLELKGFIDSLTTRVVTLEQKPDEVTPEEKRAIEAAIYKLVSEQGYGWLVSGMTVQVGGNTVSLQSAVSALLGVAQVKDTFEDDIVAYRPMTVRVELADGSTKVFSNTTTTLDSAAMATQLKLPTGVNVNDGHLNVYRCANFSGGVPAEFRTVYERKVKDFGMFTVDAWVRRAKSNLLVTLQGLTAPPVVTQGVDVDGNGTVDGSVVTDTPKSLALTALNNAIAAQTIAGAELVTVQSDESGAQVGLTNTTAARDAAQSVASTQAAYNAALDSGDQAQIDAASADMAAAQAREAAVVSAQANVDSYHAVVVVKLQAKTAADALVATRQAAYNAFP